ncbi:hypothetical protein AAC387_Pa07g0098 [Persea americana]
MAENKDDHEMKRKGEIRTLFGNRRCRSVREEATTDKRFPPPMPLLSQTGSSSCVLKRSYTDNGRLVIQEVKVKHHKFFHAHRINGRLTLQLVKMDKEPTCPDGLREKERGGRRRGRSKESGSGKWCTHEKTNVIIFFWGVQGGGEGRRNV